MRPVATGCVGDVDGARLLRDRDRARLLDAPGRAASTRPLVLKRCTRALPASRTKTSWASRALPRTATSTGSSSSPRSLPRSPPGSPQLAGLAEPLDAVVARVRDPDGLRV